MTHLMTSYVLRACLIVGNWMVVGKSCSKLRGAISFGKPTIDECSFCHKKGHWKKDCPKLNGKEKKENLKAVIV